MCGRPVAAQDKNEYTAARARLVIGKGLCVCPAQAPVEGGGDLSAQGRVVGMRSQRRRCPRVRRAAVCRMR